MVMTKTNSQLWFDTFETEIPQKQERYLIRHSLITTENYLGFIEMCHCNDLGEYNISYSVRFNYINGLPKLTIFNKTHKAKNYQEANNLFLNLKKQIEAFIF